MCMFCRSFFVLLYFFFYPLCCLFFDLRILITPLHTFLLTATCYDLDFFSQFFGRKFLISLMKKPEDFEIGIEEELEIWLCSFICVFIYMYLGVFIELLILPEHLSSSLVFRGVRVTRSLPLCIYFVDRCLSFCTFSFIHCVVCSSIYGF
jgi:hypothetical protein